MAELLNLADLPLASLFTSLIVVTAFFDLERPDGVILSGVNAGSADVVALRFRKMTGTNRRRFEGHESGELSTVIVFVRFKPASNNVRCILTHFENNATKANAMLFFGTTLHYKLFKPFLQSDFSDSTVYTFHYIIIHYVSKSFQSPNEKLASSIRHLHSSHPEKTSVIPL